MTSELRDRGPEAWSHFRKTCIPVKASMTSRHMSYLLLCSRQWRLTLAWSRHACSLGLTMNK